ncbi:hydrogenase expression/formation C-terminal domain-containing protein [Methylomonas sp. 11b]|uniref:hydrogenase expression/formation C-terminal domain-containing protein n=1 Tax=Methylomonas sp. 11b TaxID=1168169 RepID=UPI00047B5BD9|nr:hydrogenase expression/formation C-terminal domain-containing protein [Methylomonas sp. 11b]
MERVNTFANIPILVVDSTPVDNLVLAKTLLNEIHNMLSNLLDTGETGVLDLRALPSLGEEGYQFLKNQLGTGEVSARIQSFGHSEIQETAFSGIWWVSHFNQDDDIYTEQIEISFFPEILKSHKDDVVLSRSTLGNLLKTLAEQ